METKMTGAEILVACLKEQGVDTIFGYPGGSVLAVYDALGRDGTVRLVTNCHEQFATLRTAMRVRPAAPASYSRPAARARPISLPASPTPIWTRRR